MRRSESNLRLLMRLLKEASTLGEYWKRMVGITYLLFGYTVFSTE